MLDCRGCVEGVVLARLRKTGSRARVLRREPGDVVAVKDGWGDDDGGGELAAGGRASGAAVAGEGGCG